MSSPHLSPSALFSEQGAPALPGHPALLGGRCRACNGLFYPMQHYGCEVCGSTDLEAHPLSGRGRLVTLTEVHLHASPQRKAPFTVGSVVLDEGPVVRALLDPAVAANLRPGDVVCTLLVPETREGLGAHDLRFTQGA